MCFNVKWIRQLSLTQALCSQVLADGRLFVSDSSSSGNSGHSLDHCVSSNCSRTGVRAGA